MLDLQLFSGSSNVALAKDICACLNIELGKLDITTFSNGNLSVQIKQNVREKDVFVIQSFTEPVNRNIIELFITMDALRSASARRITAVIPYFSYSRSDKKDAPRISITARLMADLIKEAGASRVLTNDPVRPSRILARLSRRDRRVSQYLLLCTRPENRDRSAEK